MDTLLFLNREIRLINLAVIQINLHNMGGGGAQESLQHSKNISVQWRQLDEAALPW